VSNVNIGTLTMQKLSNMMVSIDEKLAKMGETPYGVRESTRKEQLAMASQLSSNDIIALMEKHGVKEVNDWLSRFKEKNDGRQMV